MKITKKDLLQWSLGNIERVNLPCGDTEKNKARQDPTRSYSNQNHKRGLDFDIFLVQDKQHFFSHMHVTVIWPRLCHLISEVGQYKHTGL